LFAAGDCAETNHLVTGRPVWLPLGTTANKTGRVAGANAAGRRERFPGVVGTTIVRVCGLGLAFTGLSENAARREGFQPVSVRIDALDRPRYFRGRRMTVQLTADRQSRRLLGAAIVGEQGIEGRINVAATAISHNAAVEDLESLDLCYAPPFATVWDPLLIAAQQLAKLIH
jgi:NADPH-dependent 2,4-dienoyl-CoA reductase/sulfur reductase-like enzyme